MRWGEARDERAARPVFAHARRRHGMYAAMHAHTRKGRRSFRSNHSSNVLIGNSTNHRENLTGAHSPRTW